MTEDASPGTGPGVITKDGCAVEVYRSLPPRTDIPFVEELAGPGGTVLDLGAGAGRLADPLARRGLRVVAVDEAPEMLALVQDAEPVLGSIEDLDLGERFDVVVLASHLVNTADALQGACFLRTAAHHVAPTGAVAMEWHPPEWFDSLTPGRHVGGAAAGFAIELEVHDLRDGVVDATVSYRRDADQWTQHFRARRLTEQELASMLTDAGLAWAGYLGDDRSWVLARPAIVSAP